MRKLSQVLACGILLFLAQVFALSAQNSHRPRIGLVLNGGGALGLAHIGALQWMDEHHIPVDMVAGTSMGGLVGGAFAAGETPEQIQTLVEGIDWSQILSDSSPYRSLFPPQRRPQRLSRLPAAGSWT